MLKYPCLVLDHDDTVVRSEETVNYPQFLEMLSVFRPGITMTRPEFTRWCFDQGYSALCKNYLHFTEDEEQRSFRHWQSYVRTHIPPAYEGFKEILLLHKSRGGKICVVSHSARENITRDYQFHFGIQPDMIYGWELGEEKRKPNPYPLLDIMKKTGFSPSQLLMVDDLKLGYDMAKKCGVSFACAGWSHYLPEIAAFMRQNCQLYFSSVAEFSQYLFV